MQDVREDVSLPPCRSGGREPAALHPEDCT